MKISYVHLYSSYFSIPLATKILNRLQIIFPLIKIDLKSSRDYFSKNMIADDNGGKLVRQLPKDSFQHFDVEKTSSIVDTTGIIIDGFYLQRIYTNIIDKNEIHLEHIHIIFEDKLICTFDEVDRRFHARPIICGSPTIISIPSIVEGPAKPKAYYFKQMMKGLLSENSKEIDKEFANRYVRNDDPRMPQIAAGYAIQAIFFFLLMVTPFAQIILVDCSILIGRKS
jgi:hypothetical protein